MHDFLRESIDTSKEFLRTAFSKKFWKDAVAAVLITAFTKAVKAFLDTAAKVAIGIARDLFNRLFRRHKYDNGDDFDGSPGGFDNFEMNFDGGFEDCQGRDIKQKNLQEFRTKATKKPHKPAPAVAHPDIDDIGMGGNSPTDKEIFDREGAIDVEARDVKDDDVHSLLGVANIFGSS